MSVSVQMDTALWEATVFDSARAPDGEWHVIGQHRRGEIELPVSVEDGSLYASPSASAIRRALGLGASFALRLRVDESEVCVDDAADGRPVGALVCLSGTTSPELIVIQNAWPTLRPETRAAIVALATAG